jgi:hypothetical protein
MSLDHKKEVGYPPDSRGVDFLQEKAYRCMEMGDMSFDTYKKVKAAGDELDDWMDRNVGFRNPALKMYYPEDGYIAWHHNGNANGYNILFTYKFPDCNQKSYWRHVDPTGNKTEIPDPKKIVTIEDVPGWHCKTGYYGRKEEPERLLWHSAFGGPRITLGFIVYDERMWLDVLDELADWDDRNVVDTIHEFSGPSAYTYMP